MPPFAALDRRLHGLIAEGRKIVDAAEEAGRALTNEDRNQLRRIHSEAARTKAAKTRSFYNIPTATAAELENPGPSAVDAAALHEPAGRGAGAYSGREDPIDDAVGCWLKFGLGIPPADHEMTALSSFGYSPVAGEIAVNMQPHQALTGPALCENRTGLPWSTLNAMRVLNAMTVGSDPSGGYLIRPGFVRSLEIAMLANSAMLQGATVVRTTTGEPLPWPTSDDTQQEGELLPEGRAAGEKDIEIGSIVFGSYTYSSKMVRVSNTLIRDGAVDVGGLVGRFLGERLGRILNRHCTTGDAAAKPKGLLEASTLGKTAASATAIAADEILQLIYSVDASYRPGAVFMMHDNVFLQVSLLKDGNGNYILQPGSLADATPDRIRGYPVIANAHMPATIEASAKTILFGQTSKYLIRQVGRLILRRLVEREAEFNRTIFIAFNSCDGNLLDAGTHPVKYYQQKA